MTVFVVVTTVIETNHQIVVVWKSQDLADMYIAYMHKVLPGKLAVVIHNVPVLE